MTRYLAQYTSEIKSDQNLKELRQLLKIADLEVEEKALFMQSFIAHLGDKETLSQEDITDFIAGSLLP